MAVEGVALEDFGDRVVEQAALRDVFDAAGQFVGWVELEERVGPELTFGERRIDRLLDGGICDVDEAADVAGVIGHDLCVGVEDVHSQNLGSGWQRRNVLNLKAKVQSIIFDQGLCS